jgi:hypothetical protein
VRFYVSLDDSSGRVIGGRVAKTAWVDMQPAFAAHKEREAGLGLGRLGRLGGQGGQGLCGWAVRGMGWAGLGWACGLYCGRGDQREEGGNLPC